MPLPAMSVIAFAMPRKCSKNLIAMSSYTAVLRRQFQRDPHQVERVHRHPRGAVGLVDEPAGRQRVAAVEHADVVEAQEPALEHVPPLRVLAVHPPREVDHQLVEHLLQELPVGVVLVLLVVPVLDVPAGAVMWRCLRSIWNTRHAAHAWTGGLASEKFHS